MTQNAVVRVMSNRLYGDTGGFNVEDVIGALRTLAERTDHEFWADSISITEDATFDTDKLHGPLQLTDVYLLALAVENRGRFVTYDRKIPVSAVRTARPDDLVVLVGT